MPAAVKLSICAIASEVVPLAKSGGLADMVASLAAEQVRRGMAWVHLRYVPFGSPLYEAEANARLRKVGLWRGKEPVPPWEWRARTGEKAGKKSPKP